MLTNLKIKYRIALGYGAVVLAIVFYATLMLIDASAIRRLSESISSINTPTVQASTKMSNAINSALASLRGWLLIAGNDQKEQRKDAWLSIREAEIEMQSLSLHWGDVDNVSRFNKIKDLLEDFEKYQVDIERLAHKAFNKPASNILFTIAAPMAAAMSVHITRMIDLERKQRSSPKRTELLFAMANARGSHGYELASIRAYLLSADNGFKEEYYRQEKKSIRAYSQLLQLQNIMTAEQKSNFNEFSLIREKFNLLPARMFSIREKPDWNRANYLLKMYASPKGNEILKYLSEMIYSQNKILAINGRTITDYSRSYTQNLLALSIVVIILAIVIGIYISRNIEKDLTRAVNISKKIAKGDFTLNLTKQDRANKSELGELMRSLASMANELSDKQKALIESHGQIIQSNKLAALGKMAANIAHEINSPLQAISIYTYKLNENSENGEQHFSREWVEKIERSVKNISAIVESLRKLSRDSTNDQFEEARIADIINDVLELCKERFTAATIRLDIKFQNNCEDSRILGQSIGLSQVITNLLNNSYDAVIELKEKWVSIEVLDTGKDIEVAITDSGKGIPPEIQDKIFQAMFTSKDIGKGTGIGLSISLGIARQHKGRLVLDSESKNTRFILTIPKNSSTLESQTSTTME